MRTAILFLFLFLLLLLPSVDGKNKADSGSSNNSPVNVLPSDYIIEWCTRTKLRLAPEKVKQINQNCTTDEKCFASEVVSSCSDLNTDDWLKSRVVGECALNAVYDRYGFNIAKVESAISTICDIYKDKGQFKDLDCKKKVPKECLESFHNSSTKTNIGTTNMSRKWCGSYKGNTVDFKSKGKKIALKCVNKADSNDTTNWLTDDVAKCTFHSILKNKTADHKTLIHQACEFFKYYGFNGYCQNFTSNCLEILKPNKALLCSAQADQHLQPKDIKEKIEEKCNTGNSTEKGACFGRRVAKYCKKRNNGKFERNIGQCIFHTLYYYNFGGSSGNRSLAEDSAILTGCEEYFNGTGFDCDRFNKTCRDTFKSPYSALKPPDITKNASKWCAVDYINSKEMPFYIEKNLDQAAYQCYQKWGNSKSPTKEWLNDKVAQCTFHSIFNNRARNWTELQEDAKRSCEYFKTFGFGGTCGEFVKKCSAILKYLYSPTTSTTEATTEATTPTSTETPKLNADNMAETCGVENTVTVEQDPDILSGCSDPNLWNRTKNKCSSSCENKISPCVRPCVFTSIYRTTCSSEENITKMMEQGCEHFKNILSDIYNKDLKCRDFANKCYKKLTEKEPWTTTVKSTTTSTAASTEATVSTKKQLTPKKMSDAFCGVDKNVTVEQDPDIGCSEDLWIRTIDKCRDSCTNKSSCKGACIFTSLYRTTCSSEEVSDIKLYIKEMMKMGCKHMKKTLKNTENLNCSDYADKCYKKLSDKEPRTTTVKSTTTTPTLSTVLTTLPTSSPSTTSTPTSTSTPISSSAVPMTPPDVYRQTRPRRVATKWYNRPTPPPGEDSEKEDDDDGGRALRLQREREEEQNKKEAESDNTSVYVGVSVGVGVIVLLLVIVVMVVVVRIKKRKKAKEEEDQKKKTLTSKSSVSCKTDGKKPLLKKPQPMKPISDPEVPIAMDPLAIKDFNHEGPLRVDIGLHGKPLKHGTGEEEGSSLHEEIVFNKTLNRVRRMGSDVELVNSSEMETAEVPEASKTEGKAEKSAEDKTTRNKKIEKSSDDKSARNKKTEMPMVQTRKKPSKRPLK